MGLSRVFAYILLFVIKCRFPSGKSVADIIRARYDEETLTKVRKFEKLDFKVRKCQLDVEFIQLCVDNDLVPKFLNFKVTNGMLRGSKTYRDCQRKLLKQELANRRTQHKTKLKEFKSIKNELVRKISLVDYTHLITIFTNSNDKTLSKCQKVHKKKLYDLGYFESNNGENDPDQVIYNYSSYILTDMEKSLLAKGLNFSLPPRKLNFADYMTPFELLYRNVKDCDISSHTLDVLKVGLKNIAFSSFNRYNYLRELNLSKNEFDALKKLSSMKDIVIHKSDKGNSVVIVNRTDYLNRLHELVDDETKFEKLNVREGKDYNFMVKEKSKVDAFLTMLREKNSIDEKQKQELTPDGPNPA